MHRDEECITVEETHRSEHEVLCSTEEGRPSSPGSSTVRQGNRPASTDNHSSPELPDPKKHITIWHKTEKRKIAGNAAPHLRNLDKYLRKNDQYERYTDQDEMNSRRTAAPRRRISRVLDIESLGPGEHLPVWNILEQRKIQRIRRTI